MPFIVAKANDTFARLSRVLYGDESGARILAASNPGVSEPIARDTQVIFPDIRPDFQPAQSVNANNASNEISLYINNKKFVHWSQCGISRALDSFSAVSFSSPFDADNADFVQAFKPLSFAPVRMYLGNVLQFTGFILDINPAFSAGDRSVSVAAYSRAAVLQDCTFSASSFPLEFNNVALDVIAGRLLEPFGLAPSFPDGAGPVFERVAPEPTDNAFDFLAKLAQQRNMVIADDSSGNPVFYRALESGNSVAYLAQGEQPLLSVSQSIDAKNYFSHITAIAPGDVGFDGSQFTAENSRLKTIFRPHTFKASETDGADTVDAVAAKAGRMMGNVVTYDAEVSTLRDPSGQLWRENTLITLRAPDAMVYTDYQFLVRNVEFSRDGNSESAKLSLVIPGSFSGKIPDRLPWE